jgi:hypothetical protein
MQSKTARLAVVFTVGAPAGAVLMVLAWLMVPALVGPSVSAAWRDYGLAVYVLAPLWAPVIVGVPVVSVSTRYGWIDWERV